MKEFDERIREYLLRCRDNSELAHAYLFTGLAKSGKKELIEWFCGALCASETILLESSIKDARNVISRISQTTFDGGRRIIICVHAEQLTNEAGNALLTSVEEPPEGTLFLFSAPSEKAVLPTIVSRCQIIRMPIANQLSASKEERDLREKSYCEWRSALAAPLWKKLLEKHDDEDIAIVLEEQEFFIHRLLTEYASATPHELAESLERVVRIRDLRMYPSLLSSRSVFDRIILFSS